LPLGPSSFPVLLRSATAHYEFVTGER
jgi:hypothetical protein